ncbi:hypothetical protein KOI35_22730 [Actinoplanes bogorensis]|uniref:Uncharacterized protein n=1 Tax=Paractinoplanes bogorensis TaxID=1610840 RepID=A0ABS5YS93_9ACTN|nr:hypothetical protein [Actinoplanes bogorensis]MBU2666322.1 hypothetical protein [Actinoplanes bogorensis]
MSVIATRVNADPVLATVRIDADEACDQVGGMPVLATPATFVAVAAGVAAVGSVAGLFAAGYAAGRNFGGPRPPAENSQL